MKWSIPVAAAALVVSMAPLAAAQISVAAQARADDLTGSEFTLRGCVQQGGGTLDSFNDVETMLAVINVKDVTVRGDRCD